MNEKRTYERIRLDIPTLFYYKAKHTNYTEFFGQIKNICENGFLLEITDEKSLNIAKTFQIDEELSITFTDEYYFFKAKHSTVVSADAIIVRLVNLDNKVLLGCKVIGGTSKIDRYVQDKKAANFIAHLN